MNIRLELTVDELNTVIRALESLPYRDVALLITQVHGQAEQQIRARQLREAQRSARRAERAELPAP